MDIWTILLVIILAFIVFAVIKKLLHIIAGIGSVVIILLIIASLYAQAEMTSVSDRLAKEDKILVYVSDKPETGALLEGQKQTTLNKQELQDALEGKYNSTWIIIFNKESFSSIQTVQLDGNVVDAEPFRKSLDGSPEEMLKLIGSKAGSVDEVKLLAFTVLASSLLQNSDPAALIAQEKIKILPETITFKLLKWMPWLR